MARATTNNDTNTNNTADNSNSVISNITSAIQAVNINDGNHSTSASTKRSRSQPNNNISKYEEKHVAVKEQRAVVLSKILVISVLFLAVASITSTIFFVFKNEEEKDFETQFQSYAKQLIEASKRNAETTFGIVNNFAITSSSFADDTNQAWPNVTIPDFADRNHRLVDFSRSNRILFAPIVPTAKFEPWMQYARTNKIKMYEDDISYLPVNQQQLTAEDLAMNESFPWVFKFADTDDTIDTTTNKNAVVVEIVPEKIADQTIIVPTWQTYPLSVPPLTYYNIISNDETKNAFDVTMLTRKPTLILGKSKTQTSDIKVEEKINGGEMERKTFEAELISQSFLVQPIFERYSLELDSEKRIVGILLVVIDWELYFQNILNKDAKGLIVVLSSSCSSSSKNKIEDKDRYSVTYRVDGPNVEVIGDFVSSGNRGGDVHDPKYDYLKIEKSFADFNVMYEKEEEDKILMDKHDICIPKITLTIYPSEDLESLFKSNNPGMYAIGVIVVFVITNIVFIIYDYFVTRRQNKVMARIARQDKIVSNMFPAAIRNRLYANEKDREQQGNKDADPTTNPDGLFFNGGQDNFEDDIGNNTFATGHIAELYPSVSLIFADLVGFTAWSSAREPAQVFILLETIYSKFDKIAYKHGYVFKVETVGDCYVAVSGLPERCDNHVVVISKFARDILAAMIGLTRILEVSLGPDTSDLGLRIGVHSGQVTAGVLRGQRSRFQLFGDAMNMTAKMESTGKRNQIQLSKISAKLLMEQFGKGKWVKAREDAVTLKGKGIVKTFWLESKAESKRKKRQIIINNNNKVNTTMIQSSNNNSSVECIDDVVGNTAGDGNAGRESFFDEKTVELYEEEDCDDDDDDDDVDDGIDEESNPELEAASKTERLVQWNAEVLGQLLEHILAARDSISFNPTVIMAKSYSDNNTASRTSSTPPIKALEREIGKGVTVLEEFVPIILLPEIGLEDLKKRKDPRSIKLTGSARSQLHTYLSIVAGMYPPNPFHNFEHASHVTASVRKLLTRIVSVNEDEYNMEQQIHDEEKREEMHNDIDDQMLMRGSYGITNDPLTQFAVVFSAVIHDVDHPGIPNVQLVKEQARNAKKYKGKSIAEQNSVDLAWKLLMQNEFADLRGCIYSNEEELKRFRQLVVNTVMATDIADKELGALRKKRWNAAFSTEKIDSTREEVRNGKATIVIEHLIQASDVSHTMQHWHKFIQWNRRLFFEMYTAYKAGRALQDPSENWYESEIGFFDYYIIPLAKKLSSCGVFGVSSHEYLNYATGNRDEWVRKGKDIVQEYLSSVKEMENENRNKESSFF